MLTVTAFTDTNHSERLPVSHTVTACYSAMPPTVFPNELNYFLVTETNTLKLNATKSAIKVSDFNFNTTHTVTNQFSVLSIATKMFADSRPLEGKELDVLKATFEQMLSKSPTSLHRK